MKDFVIRNDKAEEFIKEFNDNVITKEFLEECKESSKLFKEGNKNEKT